eukprot:CAMPEP_0117452358 /NCGR_PEP_ID=MMETSP0759-20121206/9566_1 /TAXON_ID=63605 /ORGANISM="Percolomonas cosmopolitus, Strain WS" /LENGTH=354 /DNA_ID=CAMNT_0005245155 /DNA_START=298 /DNA_END=1358 /DNA_ORIENTATION=+
MKGKFRPTYEELVRQTFPSPMDYDILEADNDVHWKKIKKRNAFGSFTKEPRKGEFLKTGHQGGMVGYESPKQWGSTHGATKWHKDSLSPKTPNRLSKSTEVFRDHAGGPGPGAFFEEGVPSTIDNRGSKFGTSTRFKPSNGVSQDDWENTVGPGHYFPEKSSPSKRMGVEMRGRTYSDVDYVAKERQAFPAPNQYSPEKSRRTPPANQKRGFTMGARLTTTFGASGMGSSNLGSSLFSTMTSGSFNSNLGPGSYNIRSSIGADGRSTSLKSSWKTPKRERSPGPGEYISPDDWVRKPAAPSYSFGGRNLPKLKGKRAHARFTSSRSPSPSKQNREATPGPSSYNIPSSFETNIT